MSLKRCPMAVNLVMQSGGVCCELTYLEVLRVVLKAGLLSSLCSNPEPPLGLQIISIMRLSVSNIIFHPYIYSCCQGNTIRAGHLILGFKAQADSEKGGIIPQSHWAYD